MFRRGLFLLLFLITVWTCWGALPPSASLNHLSVGTRFVAKKSFSYPAHCSMLIFFEHEIFCPIDFVKLYKAKFNNAPVALCALMRPESGYSELIKAGDTPNDGDTFVFYAQSAEDELKDQQSGIFTLLLGDSTQPLPDTRFICARLKGPFQPHLKERNFGNFGLFTDPGQAEVPLNMTRGDLSKSLDDYFDIQEPAAVDFRSTLKGGGP